MNIVADMFSLLIGLVRAGFPTSSHCCGTAFNYLSVSPRPISELFVLKLPVRCRLVNSKQRIFFSCLGILYFAPWITSGAPSVGRSYCLISRSLVACSYAVTSYFLAVSHFVILRMVSSSFTPATRKEGRCGVRGRTGRRRALY